MAPQLGSAAVQHGLSLLQRLLLREGHSEAAARELLDLRMPKNRWVLNKSAG